MIRIKQWSLVAIFLFTGYCYGQSFTEISTALVNMGRSDAAWGDFDNDNDLDLIICGIAGYDGSDDFATILYRNDAGNFVDTQSGLPGVANGYVEWGDYDGDGDQDIILIGGNPGNILYLLNNEAGVFTEVNTNLPKYGKDGVASWGDYDNDGDLDLFLASNYITDIFRNDGAGQFTPIMAGFPSLISAMGDWSDYDYDGDLDLVICGSDGSAGFCEVYRNEEGVFTAIEEDFMGLFAGAVQWGDLDGDNDPDLYINGYDETLTPFSKMYINDLGYFFEVPAGITGMALGAETLGDIDNDGDMDVFVSGNVAGCGNIGASIYLYDQGAFNVLNMPITGIVRSDGAWGDFDNDGDLDLVVTGFTASSEPYTRIFRNDLGLNEYTVNMPPQPSGELSTVVSGHNATMYWSDFSDDHTPSTSLMYNIYLGTAPGSCDIISPMSDVYSGTRYIMHEGNSADALNFEVNSLSPGTYYWSVQAIDQAYCGGSFAAEAGFEIVGVGTMEQEKMTVSVSPNPVVSNAAFLCNNMDALSIYSAQGNLMFYGVADGITMTVNMHNWKTGVYFYQVTAQNSFITGKVLKR